MRWGILIAVIILDMGVLLYLFGDKIARPDTIPTLRFSDIQDELLLVDYGGFKADLSVFQSQPMVINSWASWCTFCKEELPALAALQKEFNEVRFIAINRQESLETAKKYTDELNITDDIIFLIDTPDSFYKAIGGFTMPETIFVDKAGNVVFHKRGVMTIDEIRGETQKIIQ